MEMNVFFYRNFALMMNCTQNCELTMTLDPQVRNRLFSLSVELNQTMTLTINVSNSPPQGEAVMERTLNFYVRLEPDATLHLQSQIRLHINQTELNAELNREINVSRLTWMYWNKTQTQWVPVESYMDQNGYLVCNTDHFSTWTVAEIEDTTEALQNGIHVTYVYAGVATVVIIVLTVGLYVRTKRKK